MKKFNPFRSAIGTGIFTFVVALFIVGFLSYSGYWFGDGFRIVKTGSIALLELQDGVSVFVDNRRHGYRDQTDPGSVVIKRTTPGVHSVLVAKDGFWPWLKDVQISKDTEITLTPFLVKRNPKGELVAKENGDLDAVEERFALSALPDAENKQTSPDGLIAFWVHENSVMVEWFGSSSDIPASFCDTQDCEVIQEVFSSLDPIKSAGFYRSRNDILILASANNIFAIEIDLRGTQNFQPIYKGTNPRFIADGTDFLIIKDEEFIFRITL